MSLWGLSRRAQHPQCTRIGRRGVCLAALLLLLTWALPAVAQEGRGQVSGRVTHAESKEPLTGAQVYLEGTRHGAITSQDGRFLIPNVKPGVYRVIASNLGYAVAFRENVRVAAGTPVTVDLELKGQAFSIEGVVTTGVVDPISGLKVPFTVARVTAEEMPVPANTSMDGAIQGRIAGAQVIRSHSPGSAAYIQLRTPTSIYGENGPLYVVDGVILSSAFERTTVDIESLDVESIEVIKGAAAASLYGSRANNGVISIATRRGSELPRGRPRIMARSEFGVSQLGNRIPVANKYHYSLTNEEGNFIDAAGNVLADPFTGRQVKADRMMDNPWGPIKTYDNFRHLYRSGQFRGNTFTVAQNAAWINYSLSYNNYRTTGVLEENDGFERNSVRFNVDHRPRNDLSIRFGGYHMRSFRDNVVGEPFEDLLRFLPDVDLSRPGLNGEKYRIQPNAPFITARNPLYWQMVNDNREKRRRTQGSISVHFSPIRWLTLGADLGYDRSGREIQEYRPRGTLLSESGDGDDSAVDGGINGRYRVNDARAQRYIASFTTTLHNTLGPLTARTFYHGGMERESLRESEVVGRNLTGKDLSTASDLESDSMSTALRANGHMIASVLDYDDRYIADFLIRRDGDSRFGLAASWSTYYRAAMNWRVSREAWFNVPGISEFQLRFSHGTAGGRPRYEWLDERVNVYQAGLIPNPTRSNRFLGPELTTENNFTIRTIFNNRISVDLTYVTSRTEDQILPVVVPGGGLYTQWQNAGTLSGKTYEATIEAQLINRGSFNWRSALVLDRSRNKVERFDRPCYRDDFYYYCAGMAMGEFWTTRFHKKPEELAYRHNAEAFSQFQVNDEGLLVWVGESNSWKDGLEKDLWGTASTIDGTVYYWGLPFHETAADGEARRFKTGDANPDLNLGWGNQIRWQSFSLFAQITGQLGGDIYNTTRSRMYNRRRHADVQQGGKPAELKKPIDYYIALYNNGNFTDYFIEDGSYAKLSELSIRYNLHQGQIGALSRLGLSNLSLGLVGRNLYTLTNYSGYDPEVGSIFNRRDANPYPPYRTFTGEVRVTF